MSRSPASREDRFTALADGLPTPPDVVSDGPEGESLRLLTDVRDAFRDQLQARQRPPSSHPQFTWGELRVFETLGQGGYGTVYRANDPWLARDVALKLFTCDVAGGSRLIHEARLLAGLRHPNVLMIHGAAVREGRVGYWSEWLQGMTLAQQVARDGAFSVEEGLRIARDLAAAIHAVHRIGLVHGDVKAENVMRESGGRVVLMDFGASGNAGALAAQLLVSGTPRYLAPEVLKGAPISVASDWYAFGATVYLMFAGELPFPSLPLDALRELKRRPPPSILTRRSDLTPALALWVDSLIAPKPAKRPDPSEIARFLAAACQARPVDRGADTAVELRPPAPSTPAPKPSFRRARAITAVVAIVFALALGAHWRFASAPAWEADVRFLRMAAQGDEVLSAHDRLAPSDRFYLQMRSNRPSFVYVLNEDADGIATVLYPSARDANPVPAGVELRLPGTAQSRLAWQLTSASAHEEFVVISAAEALPTLEAELRKWQQVAAPGAVRAAGAVVAVDPAVLSGARLRAALAEAAAQPPGEARVWQFRFATRSDQRQSPDATKPAQ
jgi:serine/threonine protein kinase